MAVLSELRRRLLARCKTFINGASLTADRGEFTVVGNCFCSKFENVAA